MLLGGVGLGAIALVVIAAAGGNGNAPADAHDGEAPSRPTAIADSPEAVERTAPPSDTMPDDAPSASSSPAESHTTDESQKRAVTANAPVFAQPEDLCSLVTADAFEAVTGVAVTLEAAPTTLQCDYRSDAVDGFYARLSAQVPDDYTTWADYAATQPSGPGSLTLAGIGDGAIVTVSDGGSGLVYGTAESGVGTTVITWQLALPGTEDAVRGAASDLLERVAIVGP